MVRIIGCLYSRSYFLQTTDVGLAAVLQRRLAEIAWLNFICPPSARGGGCNARNEETSRRIKQTAPTLDATSRSANADKLLTRNENPNEIEHIILGRIPSCHKDKVSILASNEQDEDR